ncbi:hypothetical protein KAI56_03050 [Candidatus Parcubacteria bacterium]|nr:hypothetical protein [Candidatus Parcubacteria bacterium]
MEKILRKSSAFFVVLFVAIGLFSFVQLGFAQESEVGISISPLTFELTANPGDTLVSEVGIINKGGSPLPITIKAEDFTAAGETGGVIIEEEGNETYSLAKWIKVNPENIILEPNERKVISVEIVIPTDGEAGGHYGSIVAFTGGNSDKNNVGSTVSMKVASLILLNVSGEVIENMNVLNFSAPEFQEYGPVPFEMRFENEGTVHVKPRGFITITDMFGNKVKDLEFPSKNVLPGSVRKIETEWDGGFLMGKYTAMIVGSYGNSNEPFISNTITFTIFPWKLALGILSILMVIITFFFKTRKRWRMAAKILFKGEHHTTKKGS